MKHCFLITAHDNLKVTIKLINLLNDENAVFYIHIDKKQKDINHFLNYIKHFNNVHIIPRINVYWGSYSQIKVTLMLLKQTVKYNYDYYHLISGTTPPIKNKTYIYDFYRKNKNMEFIEKRTNHGFTDRFTHWHFIQGKIIKSLNIIRHLNKLFYFLPRHVKNIESFYKASNWCSITHDFAKYILDNEKWINKSFKFSFCCDEVFIATLLMNSKFKNKNYGNNMLYTDWSDLFHQNKSLPITLDDKYISVLKNSKCLFARKFNEDSMNIVDELN